MNNLTLGIFYTVAMLVGIQSCYAGCGPKSHGPEKVSTGKSAVDTGSCPIDLNLASLTEDLPSED